MPNGDPLNSAITSAQLPRGPLSLPDQSDPHHHLWTLLESVVDPEIPVVSLREMGVLRAIREGHRGVEVVITPTYSGCPAMSQMHDDVASALQAAGVQASIVTELSPAWSSDWITVEAKHKLKTYGIAPPHACRQASDRVVHIHQRTNHSPVAVACPQCDSLNTTETSHFGSTACKAMYRCLDCLEPFDYFKPY